MEALKPCSSFDIPQDENSGYYNFTIYVKLSSSGIKVDTLDLSVKVSTMQISS